MNTQIKSKKLNTRQVRKLVLSAKIDRTDSPYSDFSVTSWNRKVTELSMLFVHRDRWTCEQVTDTLDRYLLTLDPTDIQEELLWENVVDAVQDVFAYIEEYAENPNAMLA